MSSHSVRPRAKKSTYLGFSRSALAVLFLVLVVALPLLIAHPWTKVDRLTWPSVEGRVLETRVVVSQIEHQYRPSEIVYQVQAQVSYKRDGTEYNTWLPVSKLDSDKAFLEFWLSQKKSKTCTVRWPPKNPSYVEAVLY
jgi:hypothetical protein